MRWTLQRWAVVAVTGYYPLRLGQGFIVSGSGKTSYILTTTNPRPPASSGTITRDPRAIKEGKAATGNTRGSLA